MPYLTSRFVIDNPRWLHHVSSPIPALHYNMRGVAVIAETSDDDGIILSNIWMYYLSMSSGLKYNLSVVTTIWDHHEGDIPACLTETMLLLCLTFSSPYDNRSCALHVCILVALCMCWQQALIIFDPGAWFSIVCAWTCEGSPKLCTSHDTAQQAWVCCRVWDTKWAMRLILEMQFSGGRCFLVSRR